MWGKEKKDQEGKRRYSNVGWGRDTLLFIHVLQFYISISISIFDPCIRLVKKKALWYDIIFLCDTYMRLLIKNEYQKEKGKGDVEG
jgi:hypothetical protein